ncbi:hypothetical protein VNO80_17312 [Phaseolus coccineus]|uniref:Uncharacterized protein n=1 Tax=Phaseolus coccineus TaxID=3886 RepID=A0AAN9MUV6_PHACN
MHEEKWEEDSQKHRLRLAITCGQQEQGLYRSSITLFLSHSHQQSSYSSSFSSSLLLLLHFYYCNTQQPLT